MAKEDARQMRMLISYGGSFVCHAEREERAKVRYVGGESKIISVDRRGINLRNLLSKVSELIPGALLSVPAHPPELWLSHLLVWATGPDDAGGRVLVPIFDDAIVTRMMAEQDRLAALGKPARLRVFLCDRLPSPTWQLGEGNAAGDATAPPAGKKAQEFLEKDDSFPGVSSRSELAKDDVNASTTTRATEKKGRGRDPHCVSRSENAGPPGFVGPSAACRRYPPRPPSCPPSRSCGGTATEALRKSALLARNQGIQNKSSCFLNLLQREIESRRRTAAHLHGPQIGAASGSLLTLETPGEGIPTEEEGRKESSTLPSAAEVAPQTADAKVQADIFELLVDAADSPGMLPSILSLLPLVQLQTIRNVDLEEIRELGSGAFGTVFHGRWKGSDVAIKRFRLSCFTAGGAVRDRLVAEFWKEVHLLATLHHPNLVAFYGVVTDGRRTKLATVTEFMVNGSLKQVLGRKDGIIDRKKRIIIAMDAAFGMEYLHEKGVVHFDLKSHNFLVNMRDPARPVCKIGDLGLSKVKRRTLVSGGVRGTIPWMAPELLNSLSNMVTEKVDVYSFGIVMWELLTGEEPFGDMPTEEVIGGIVKGDLRPHVPSWCEPTWRSLMERCWAADPSRRPPFSAIAAELRAMAAAMNVLC